MSHGKTHGCFDLIVLDEAHGAVASQYLQLLEKFPKAAVVGLTATPFRLNPKEDLGKVFKRSVVGPTISTLIARKVLYMLLHRHLNNVLYSSFL